jgi:hypothetical protein
MMRSEDGKKAEASVAVSTRRASRPPKAGQADYKSLTAAELRLTPIRNRAQRRARDAELKLKRNEG